MAPVNCTKRLAVVSVLLRTGYAAFACTSGEMDTLTANPNTFWDAYTAATCHSSADPASCVQGPLGGLGSECTA
jgi:hypothetical protein